MKEGAKAVAPEMPEQYLKEAELQAIINIREVLGPLVDEAFTEQDGASNGQLKLVGSFAHGLDITSSKVDVVIPVKYGVLLSG